MRDPLIVYDSTFQAADIDTNGLRCLSPTKAEHTIEENQAGSIHVVCPIDEDGDWKAIQLNNVVKAPVEFRGEKKPQLFRIYRIKKSRSGGVPSIEFDARHIFYDLNYVMLQDVRPENKNGLQAITHIMSNPYAPAGTSQLPVSRFTYASDITDTSTAYFEWKTISGALIGEDNCILNRWGGSLWVDNYYFSINTVRENAQANAFVIAYGYNLTDISETVDCTNTFSRVAANDNNGHSGTASVSITELGLPFEKTVHASFSYDKETANSGALFQQDLAAYSQKIMEVQASYSVKFADIPDDDPFMALKPCEVGDTGTIIDDELGIETTQRVIKTVTDLLTGERISTDTGNVMPSISRRAAFSNTVSVTKSAEQKQIDALEETVTESKAIYLMNWGSARALTWAQASQYTWRQAAEIGGASV